MDCTNATMNYTIVECPNCGTANYIYSYGIVTDKHYCAECGEKL